MSTKIPFEKRLPCGSKVRLVQFGRHGHLPCIVRMDGRKFCSKKMATKEILGSLMEGLPGTLALYKAPWTRKSLKNGELEALEQAAAKHGLVKEGSSLLMGSDSLVLAEDIEKALDILETCHKKMKDPSSQERFGFIKGLRKDGGLVPFLKKANAKLVPTQFLKDMGSLKDFIKENAIQIVGWDTQYLVFCCQLMYVGDVAGKPFEVIDVQVLQAGGGEDTKVVYEETWPCCPASFHTSTKDRCPCPGQREGSLARSVYFNAGPSKACKREAADEAEESLPPRVGHGKLPTNHNGDSTDTAGVQTESVLTHPIKIRPTFKIPRVAQARTEEQSIRLSGLEAVTSASAKPPKALKRPMAGFALSSKLRKTSGDHDHARNQHNQGRLPRISSPRSPLQQRILKGGAQQVAPPQPSWTLQAPALPNYVPNYGFPASTPARRTAPPLPEQYLVREVKVFNHKMIGVAHSTKENAVDLILAADIRNTFFPQVPVFVVEGGFKKMDVKLFTLKESRAEALRRAGHPMPISGKDAKAVNADKCVRNFAGVSEHVQNWMKYRSHQPPLPRQQEMRA